MSIVVNGGVYGHHAWDVQIKELTKPVLVVCVIIKFNFRL